MCRLVQISAGMRGRGEVEAVERIERGINMFCYQCEQTAGGSELPLSIILSWFEQKAVAILLTLLYLGAKGIRIGPTPPAFITPGVSLRLKSKKWK